MSPSVDIKTPSPRSMKSSLDEAGPPSPIDLDTPEEDKEEQEEKKKKKKKKKKREDGQDVSQPVQMDVSKEKMKRKRRMEDEGSEVMEREKKRKKGGEEMRREGVEEDVVKEGEEKKRKKKKKNLEEEMIVEVIVVKEGGKKKVRKEKKNNLEEVIEVVEEIMVKEGGKKKKKKEKNNNLEEEVIEVVEEIVVKEGGEKKKKKKKLGEERIEGVEEDVVNGGEEKKKKKKKKVVDQPVEENAVNEGGEKKKKKQKKVVHQTIEAIEENAVNEGGEKKKKKQKKVVDQPVEENAVNEGGEKKKRKKKKVVHQTIEAIEENAVNEGGEKKKRKKKKVVEETIERVEENVVNEGGEKKKKNKKKGVKLEEKGGGVVELNGDGEKKKTGTTQEAKKKKRKKRATSDGKREGGEEVKKRAPFKIDLCRLEDLLEEPDVKEILEYFPRVRSRMVIERLRRYDLHRFREFKKQGISLRRGRCTAEEKSQIRTNVKDFLVLTGITSAQDLFFPHRCKERSKEIKKLRTEHRFMEKMGEGLYRSCFQVYILAKKMTDELNHLGRFDDEEILMLQRLQTRHGNDWREIAKSMDRSVESLQKRFAHIAINHGVWESDEEGRLKQALLAHLETLVGPEQTGSASGPWLTSEQLCKNLPWKSISEKVQTRCWTQCREKWFNLLKSKMASDNCPAFSGGVKAIRAKVKLINTLYNMDVEDPALIEWDEVAITIGEVSERYVQKSFHRLKVASVPRWNELSYPDIIDFLQDKVVPKLEEHLKEAGDTDLPCEQKYFLSHICSSGEVDSGLTVA